MEETIVISYGFSPDDAKYEGWLGTINESAVPFIVNTSVAYARSWIKGVSLATLVECIDQELLLAKRKSILKLLVSAINKNEEMKKRGYRCSISFEKNAAVGRGKTL